MRANSLAAFLIFLPLVASTQTQEFQIAKITKNLIPTPQLSYAGGPQHQTQTTQRDRTRLHAELMRSISQSLRALQGKPRFIIGSRVFWDAPIVRHTSLNSLGFLLHWTKGITRRIDAFQ